MNRQNKIYIYAICAVAGVLSLYLLFGQNSQQSGGETASSGLGNALEDLGQGAGLGLFAIGVAIAASL
jgi:hypothetical protein